MNHPSDNATVPPRIHIVGRKNSGKTTLVCALVEEFSGRGLKVATVKHTHHHHELDTPGKDSHKHREAGASGVGILSPQMTAAFVPRERDDDDAARRYRVFETLFADCDLILVEGDLNTSACRVEVWRDTSSELPYATDDTGITAVVSDQSPDVACPVWPRRDLSRLADNILTLLQIRP